MNSRNLWIRHKSTKSLPYRNVGFWQLRCQLIGELTEKEDMNITVKVLREVYSVTPEDISNALRVKSSDVIKRCLNENDTYGAFVAIGVLIPRDLLKFEPQKAQDENERRWQGIKSIFDALGGSENIENSKKVSREYKPRSSCLPASIEADIETFKSMCLDVNCSYQKIADKFGLTMMSARYYAMKLGCIIERPRGRKKFVGEETTKHTEAPTLPNDLQNPFAGFNTSPKAGF